MNLSIELKTRIYNHIGTVQQHLGILEADEQREILESIETHIYDALETRSAGEPTLALLDAIIAEMDPPESYGPNNSVGEQKPETTPRTEPQKYEPKSRGGKGCAIAAGILLVVGAIPLILILLFFTAHETTSETLIEQERTAVQAHKASSHSMNTKDQASAQPPVIGKWTTIDFISSFSEFNPPQTKWQGELTLKGIQFSKDGTTDKPWWTWKKNRLFNSGDQSEAELMIITVNQSDYLFIEWISGDVLMNKEKPKYYVLKRGVYIDPAEPKTIIEGVGWEALRIGATRSELIDEFGTPDSRNSMVMSWSDRDLACHLGRGGNPALHSAVQLNFRSGFAGTTSKGIKIGSSEVEVLAAYGNPERISTNRRRKTMTWPKIGIQLTLDESFGVNQIDILKPFNP